MTTRNDETYIEYNICNDGYKQNYMVCRSNLVLGLRKQRKEENKNYQRINRNNPRNDKYQRIEPICNTICTNEI